MSSVKAKVVDPVKFSIQELQSLLGDPYSHVILKQNVKYPIRLLPLNLSNVNSAIFSTLNSHLMTYLPKYEGILLSYKNIKRLGDVGRITNDDYHISIVLQADLYIFIPKVNSILRGVVNKKSEDNIGCIVHKGFNVALPRPNAECSVDWPGNEAYVGQEVFIRVDFLNIMRSLPYIRGRFLNETEFEEEGISRECFIPSSSIENNEKDQSLVKIKKKNKKKRQGSEEVSEPVPDDDQEPAFPATSIGESEQDQSLIKKKKKKKRQESEEVSEPVPIDDQELVFSASSIGGSEQDKSLIKKKKKKKKCQESEDVSEPVPVDDQEPVFSDQSLIKKKKKKKRQESEEVREPVPVDDQEPVFSAASIGGSEQDQSPVKKKKKKCQEIEEIQLDYIKPFFKDHQVTKKSKKNKRAEKIGDSMDEVDAIKLVPNSEKVDISSNPVKSLMDIINNEDTLIQKHKKKKRSKKEAGSKQDGLNIADTVQLPTPKDLLDRFIKNMGEKSASKHMERTPAKKKSNTTCLDGDMTVAASLKFDSNDMSTTNSPKRTKMGSDIQGLNLNEKSKKNSAGDKSDTITQTLLASIKSDMENNTRKRKITPIVISHVREISDSAIASETEVLKEKENKFHSKDVSSRLDSASPSRPVQAVLKPELKSKKMNKDTLQDGDDLVNISNALIKAAQSELSVKPEKHKKLISKIQTILPEISKLDQPTSPESKKKKITKSTDETPDNIVQLLEEAKSNLSIQPKNSRLKLDVQSTVSGPQSKKAKDSIPLADDTENITRALLDSALSNLGVKKKKQSKSDKVQSVKKSTAQEMSVLGQAEKFHLPDPKSFQPYSASLGESSSDEDNSASKVSKSIISSTLTPETIKSLLNTSSSDKDKLLNVPKKHKIKSKKESKPITNIPNHNSYSSPNKNIPISASIQQFSSSESDESIDAAPHPIKVIPSEKKVTKIIQNSSENGDEEEMIPKTKIILSNEKSQSKTPSKVVPQAEECSNSDDDFVSIKPPPVKKKPSSKNLTSSATKASKTFKPSVDESSESSEDEATKERLQNLINNLISKASETNSKHNTNTSAPNKIVAENSTNQVVEKSKSRKKSKISQAKKEVSCTKDLKYTENNLALSLLNNFLKKSKK